MRRYGICHSVGRADIDCRREGHCLAVDDEVRPEAIDGPFFPNPRCSGGNPPSKGCGSGRELADRIEEPEGVVLRKAVETPYDALLRHDPIVWSGRALQEAMAWHGTHHLELSSRLG